MKILPLIVMPLLLSGCASLSYQEPVQGPRARVRFATDTDSLVVLRAYDDMSCNQNETEWMRLRAGYLLNSNPKKLGMPLWKHHENAAKEVYVATNKEMYALFSGGEQLGNTIYSCGVPFSYKFSENTDYEVKFHWNPRNSPGACLTTISQIVQNGSDWDLKEVARFDNQTNDSNRGCLSQFKRARLY